MAQHVTRSVCTLRSNVKVHWLFRGIAFIASTDIQALLRGFFIPLFVGVVCRLAFIPITCNSVVNRSREIIGMAPPLPIHPILFQILSSG